MRTRWGLPLAAALTIAVATPAAANHRIDVDVIARGLDNPRHIAVGKGGELYVAEAGRGGDHATSRSCFNSAEGFACTGRSGAVTKIDRRGQVRVARGLASYANASGGDAFGPHGVLVDGHKLYITNGGPTRPTRGDPPVPVLRDPTLVAEEPISTLFGRLLEVRREGRVRSVADVWAFERDVNPDAGIGNPGALINSNPVDVLRDRGRFVIVDAGGNSLLRTSHSGRLESLSVFPYIPTASGPLESVPTSVAKGPDGAYYVSELTGLPFPVGGSKVFRVDPRTGVFTTFASGFTNVLDLDFGNDGTLYVLELDRDSLLNPGTDGGLWAVSRRGVARRIELPPGTLTHPAGIAVGRHGTLYVSNHSREAGVGEVLRIDLGRRGR